MLPKSSLRVALLAALLLLAVGAFAGASAGSSAVTPHATAPRLIAHDTTTFHSDAEPGAKRGSRSGTAVRPAAHRPKSKPAVYMDTNETVTTVPSSAMGISQVLVALDGQYQVYSRADTGSTLGWTDNETFWANIGGPDDAGLCATNPQGDPSVAYDWAADRWVVSEAAYATDGNNAPTGAFVECVAVSTSADALGGWNRYVFQVSTSLYPSQQSLGVWSDGYYLSFNQATSTGTWAGAGALALERSHMLLGNTAQARYFDLENVTPGLGGMLPADINGLNQPAAAAPELYLQAHDDPLNTNDRLEVWGFHVDWTAPVTGSTFDPVVNLPISGLGFDTSFSCLEPGTPSTYWQDCLTQSPPGGQITTQQLNPLSPAHTGSSDLLPQLSGHLQWSADSSGDQTIAATTTDDVSGSAAPAWFELSNNGSGWAIENKGTVTGGGLGRFIPSSAFDNSGNIAVAYAETSGTIDPTDAYTNVTAASSEVQFTAGSVPFTASDTYGQYTTLSLDPVDLCTMWFTGPSPDINTNGTEAWVLADFSLAGCVASTTQPPELTSDPGWTAPIVREGQAITGSGAGFSGQTGTSYQWRRCDVNGWNCVDIAGANSASYTPTATDAAGTHTLRFEEIATNANPNGTSTAESTATTLVQSIPPVNDTLPVISGTAQVGDTLTTDDGAWTSSSPLSYTYRWRRCSLGTCANISGATSSSYVLTSSDQGDTVDVVVSATNTGGGTDANAAAAGPIVAAATGGSGGSGSGGSGSGGSGGGGGGGGGGAKPDIALSGSVSPASASPGTTVTLSYTVTDKNLQPATKLTLTITLPSGMTYVSAYDQRGSGCTSSTPTSVVCDLAYVSSDTPETSVLVYATVNTAATQTVSATATSDLGELSTTDNTLSLSVGQSATTTTTTKTTSGTPTGLNGNPKASAKVDKVAPTAHAVTSLARRGRVADLRFKIYDNSGVAKATALVKRNGKTIARKSTGFGPVAYGSTYFVAWRVPKKAAKGNYSFCVTAYDHAKHHSRTSCAKLKVR